MYLATGYLFSMDIKVFFLTLSKIEFYYRFHVSLIYLTILLTVATMYKLIKCTCF